MLRLQLLSLQRQLLAAEAAPAAAGGLLAGLRQLLGCQQQPHAPSEDRQYSTARRQARPASAAGRASGAPPPAAGEEEEPATELRLPDLSAIGYLNPQLREVIERHQRLQK